MPLYQHRELRFQHPRYLRALLVGAAAGALLAAASPAPAQQLGNWDSDDDLGISQPEWDSGVDENGIFDRMDRDNSGDLSEDELNAGVSDAFLFEPGLSGSFGQESAYQRWDADDDGSISENEFRAGSYQSFDTNRDGLLDDNEFPRLRQLGAGRDYPSLQGPRGGGGVGATGGVGETGNLQGSGVLEGSGTLDDRSTPDTGIGTGGADDL